MAVAERVTHKQRKGRRAGQGYTVHKIVDGRNISGGELVFHIFAKNMGRDDTLAQIWAKVTAAPVNKNVKGGQRGGGAFHDPFAGAMAFGGSCSINLWSTGALAQIGEGGFIIFEVSSGGRTHF